MHSSWSSWLRVTSAPSNGRSRGVSTQLLVILPPTRARPLAKPFARRSTSRRSSTRSITTVGRRCHASSAVHQASVGRAPRAFKAVCMASADSTSSAGVLTLRGAVIFRGPSNRSCLNRITRHEI